MYGSNTNNYSKADIIQSGLFFRNALSIFKNPLEFLSGSVKNNGPVIKLNLAGKQYFIIQHPEYVKHVLLDQNKIYHKTGHNLVRMFLGDSLSSSNGEAWAKKRRVINPAFHRQKLEDMVEGINEETTLFLNRLGMAGDISAINITNEFRQLTMSIISRTMFSTPFEELALIIKSLQELTDYSSRWMKSLVKFPTHWPTPANRRFRKNVRIFDEIIYGIISKRKAGRANPANARHNDLLDMLLDHHDDETGSPMPDEAVRDELTTMFMAGHETTTQTLSWTLYHLAKNKEILHKVRAESDLVMGDQLPTYETISKLGYTRQVVYETLRSYPSLWLLARKNIEEDNLNGFHVPSGSNVLINLYGLHHHPAYWHNADIFDPDRFDPSSDEKRPPYVFIPFAVAPRSCIGHNFAMLEMLIVVNRIAKTLDIKVPAGYVPTAEPNTTLKAKGGIQLNVNKLRH